MQEFIIALEIHAEMISMLRAQRAKMAQEIEALRQELATLREQASKPNGPARTEPVEKRPSQ